MAKATAKKRVPAGHFAGPAASMPAPAGAPVAVTPETLAAVEPDRLYQVNMRRSVKLGPTWLRPSSARTRLLGSVLVSLGDAVRSFQPVA